MIKTLRIISIIAAILACGFLAFPFVFGILADPQAEEFLKSADATEKFSKMQARPQAAAQVSPLVKQAQDFALFLNPPKPQRRPEDFIESVIRPQTVTPKFALIGTSTFPNKPEKSLALIDEPGKGIHWVKQADSVGHLTIEQIKDGIVVVNDAGRTSEIAVERPEKISFLRNPPLDNAPPVPSPVAPLQMQPPGPEIHLEAPLEEISKELEAIEQQVAAGVLDPDVAAEKSAAVMEKFMAEVQAAQSRITSEEAQNIDRLGSQLQAQREGDKPPPTTIKPPQEQQSVAPKTEDKTQDTSQQKPVPRQRATRRRGVRTRRAPVSPKPDQPEQQQ